MKISLKDMNVGDTSHVVGFDKSFPAYRQKMLAMGLTPGTEFAVIRIATSVPYGKNNSTINTQKMKIFLTERISEIACY